ncbi:MAG: Holliday junction resolvase RuvX, partial [Bacteroidetes bacterium]|nr:Holliday junction resolvase RuvX [Bacteroidota bacterium]
MKRILAIDYGMRRVGLAVTDLMQMIAQPLDTIDNKHIIDYLKAYIQKEPVEKIVLGEPKQLSGLDTDSSEDVRTFRQKLNELFPEIPVIMVDERLTSRMAKQTLIDAGYKKSDRRNKKLVDTVAAA